MPSKKKLKGRSARRLLLRQRTAYDLQESMEDIEAFKTASLTSPTNIMWPRYIITEWTSLTVATPGTLNLSSSEFPPLPDPIHPENMISSPIASSNDEENYEKADLTISEADLTVSEADLTVSEADLTVSEADLTVSEADLTVSEADFTISEADLTVSEADSTVSEADSTVSEADKIEEAAAIAQDVLTLSPNPPEESGRRVGIEFAWLSPAVRETLDYPSNPFLCLHPSERFGHCSSSPKEEWTPWNSRDIYEEYVSGSVVLPPLPLPHLTITPLKDSYFTNERIELHATVSAITFQKLPTDVLSNFRGAALSPTTSLIGLQQQPLFVQYPPDLYIKSLVSFAPTKESGMYRVRVHYQWQPDHYVSAETKIAVVIDRLNESLPTNRT